MKPRIFVHHGKHISKAARILIGAGAGLGIVLSYHAWTTMNTNLARLLAGGAFVGGCAAALSLGFSGCRVAWSDPEQTEENVISVVEAGMNASTHLGVASRSDSSFAPLPTPPVSTYTVESNPFNDEPPKRHNPHSTERTIEDFNYQPDFPIEDDDDDFPAVVQNGYHQVH